MKKKPIAVITSGSSDFLTLLQAMDLSMTIIQPDDLLLYDLDAYESILLLGGNSAEPLALDLPEANAINEQARKGKKLFVEFTRRVMNVYYTEIRSTRYERPVFVSDSMRIEGIVSGDILDEQSNDRLNLWRAGYSGRPILQYVRNAEGFYQTEVTEKTLEDKTYTALWMETENAMFCSFRLANFVKARFCPIAKWQALISYIVEWATGEKPDFSVLAQQYKDVYHFVPYNEDQSFDAQVLACAKRGLNWFTDADMLVKRKGRYYGVKEGLGPSVYADGTQQIGEALRTDCIGEVSTSFFMDYLMSGDTRSKAVADELLDIFEYNRCRTGTLFNGMNAANGMAICYQDDTARGLMLTTLFRALYTGDNEHMETCLAALDFLVRTTGTDGLRVVRTEMINEFSEKIYGMNLESYDDDGITKWKWGFYEKNVSDLAKEPGYVPSAHYNGFYIAALLLAYKITGNEKYREVGVKGMETMMSFYPATAREHSETQELCRLILPLAMLYWATGEEKHKDWLYRAAQDLQKMRHESGAYLEWDTDYIAVCSRAKDNECSVLANNGDPIADLIYSLNWLPVGLMQAYFVTGDEYFYNLWKDIAKFFVSSQIHSKDRMLNGAWPRAVDVNLKEVYGVPNDIGWAPWSVESGWTVGEIVTGLLMGLQKDKLKECYK